MSSACREEISAAFISGMLIREPNPLMHQTRCWTPTVKRSVADIGMEKILLVGQCHSTIITACCSRKAAPASLPSIMPMHVIAQQPILLHQLHTLPPIG